jgi:hypothetical protein
VGFFATGAEYPPQIARALPQPVTFAGVEERADLPPPATTADLDGASHGYLAKLLRKTLHETADERQIAVDPYEGDSADAAAVGPPSVQDHIGLAVLARCRISPDARVQVGGGTPVGEDKRASPILSGFDAGWHERGDRFWVSSEVSRDDVT